MVRIFALSLPLQAIGVDWVFRALQKMHFSAGVQVLGAAMTLPLTLLFVHSANDALRIPAINLAVVAMSGGASVIVARRLGLRYGLDFDVAAFRGHLAASIPLCASSLAITLYIQANYLILGGVRGEEEVGFYAAAARLTSALSTVHWLYYAAMAPALTSLYSQSTAQAAALLKESLRLTAVAGLGACVLGVSVADRLVPLVFGPTFTGGGAVLSVMLLSAAVVAIGHNWAQMVIAAKRERLLLASTLAGGVCNLAVCALLVRPLGALGTAVANLAAEVLVHAVLLIFCWKRLGMAEVGAVGKPALAATVGLVVAVAPLGVVSRAVLACSVYVALLVLTRALSVADVHAVVRIVRGTGSRTEGTWQ
jgi:O-antigen/teichoic acid export membrane protein